MRSLCRQGTGSVWARAGRRSVRLRRGMRPSGGAKLMSFLAFVLCLVPVLGLLLAIVAMYLARTADRGWAKSLNFLSIIIAIVSTIMGVVFFMTDR